MLHKKVSLNILKANLMKPVLQINKKRLN